MKRRSMMTMGLAALVAPLARGAEETKAALLLVAHGAKQGPWNERVLAMFEKVEWAGPKGVAFLTPRTAEESLEAVAQRLDATGVGRIVLVPLLVSSFSEHYEELRYYARARQAPPEHYEHEPLETKAAILMAGAMDSDRLLGRILADQVKAASKEPEAESVILIGHGPNAEIDNERWLACLRVQAGFLQYQWGFKHVEVATLRDDAPREVKAAAVADLLGKVKRLAADSRVLVQPVLISAGHVQSEIAALLKDQPCTVSASGVANHRLTPEWIRQQASTQIRTETAALRP